MVGAALDLLAENPAGALSVRGVAARLGVRPNALYTYLPDRAALERAVVDRLLARADPALLDGGGPWQDRIERYACALRRVLLAQPAGAALFFAAPMDGPNAALVGERLIGLFVDAGLATADAARATYTVIVHLLGSVALTVSDRPDPAVGEDELAAERLARLSTVDGEALPLSAATAPIVAGWNSEEQFRWGLRRVIEGCAGGR